MSDMDIQGGYDFEDPERLDAHPGAHEQSKTIVIERTCPFCEQPASVEVDRETWEEYETGLRLGLPAGTHGIQVLFRGLSLDDRETLISGSHGPCFDKAFGEPG